MRELLFLAHRIPFPPDRGDKIRSFHLLQALSRLGRVHLASFADDKGDAAHLAGLRAAIPALGEAHVEVRRVSRLAAGLRALAADRPLSLAAFDSPAMRRFVAGMLARPALDTVYAFSSQVAQFIPRGCRQRFVMDFVDMDSAKFGDYAEAGGPLGPVHAREARLLLAHERDTAARADLSLFVSEAEAALFRARTGATHVQALGNGVDLAFFQPGCVPAEPAGPGAIILFTGQMDYRPNVQAVTGFARTVMPRVRAARPDARFVIAGRNPAPAVRRLAAADVIVTGAVPDMRAWLSAAQVIVAPLAIGRGVQNKMLEAMAMARPIVASTAAFTGIEAEPGRDLIVADGAAAQADAVLRLLDDPAACRAIGRAARGVIESRYSWPARLAALPALMNLAPHRVAA